MAAEEKSAARGTIATVVATAAVTLAIGVTAAALGGYLVPGRTGKTRPAEVTESAVAEALPTARSAVPSVVLVPVTPDSARDPVSTAPVEPALHRHHDREHQEREHEDDHDDD